MAFSKPSRDAILSKLRKYAPDDNFQGFRDWFYGALSSARGTEWEGSVTAFATEFWNATYFDVKERRRTIDEHRFDATYAGYEQTFMRFVTSEESAKAGKGGGLFGGIFNRRGRTAQGETSASADAGAATANASVTINNAPGAAGYSAGGESGQERAEERAVLDAQRETANEEEKTAQTLEKTAEVEEKAARELEEAIAHEAKNDSNGRGGGSGGSGGGSGGGTFRFGKFGVKKADAANMAGAALGAAGGHFERKAERINSGVDTSNAVKGQMQEKFQKEADAKKGKWDHAEAGGAVAGAAIGTAIAPGIGTEIGAVVGGGAGKLVGGAAKAKLQKEAEEAKKAVGNVGNFAGFVWIFVLFGTIFLFTGVFGDFGAFGYFFLFAALIFCILLLIKKKAFLEFKVSPYGRYFVAAYLFHLFILRYFYSSGTVNLTTVVTLSFSAYLAFGLMYWVFFKGTGDVATAREQKRQNLKTAAWLLILSILLYSLPGIVNMIKDSFPGIDPNQDLYYFSIYITVLFSPWMLYSLKRMRDDFPDGNAAAIMRAFTFVAIAIPVFIILAYSFTKLMAMFPAVSITGVDAKTGMVGSVQRLKELMLKTFKRWSGLYDQAKNPGAYYTGKVEDNKKQPLGVTIEKLYPVDKIATVNESDITIIGEVKAKSFIGASISVTPSCIIESRDAPVAKSVDPREMDVIFSTTQGYQCTFEPMKKVGSFTVKSAVTFPFETWAYIPYTFVDEERARNIARQGQNVQTVLNIPASPVATYTSGPIKVGMGGSSMPLLVRPDKDPIMPPGSQIGLTIDNGWDTGGMINRVKRIELKVPKPFVLTDCTRKLAREPYEDEKEPLYNDFVFENQNLDENIGWQSLTCKLNIPTSASAEALALVAEGDAVTRSFIAVIEYDYSIEKTTSIQVK